MLTFRASVAIVFTAAALMSATAALAHPKLLSSTPADGAATAPPDRIELRFSEKLMTRFSGANLVMTGMPGMAEHSPMKMAVQVSGSQDSHVMVITPASPLVPGSYRVDWRAVASDTHPVTGSVSFTVK